MAMSEQQAGRVWTTIVNRPAGSMVGPSAARLLELRAEVQQLFAVLPLDLQAAPFGRLILSVVELAGIVATHVHPEG